MYQLAVRCREMLVDCSTGRRNLGLVVAFFTYSFSKYIQDEVCVGKSISYCITTRTKKLPTYTYNKWQAQIIQNVQQLTQSLIPILKLQNTQYVCIRLLTVLCSTECIMHTYTR